MLHLLILMGTASALTINNCPVIVNQGEDFKVKAYESSHVCDNIFITKEYNTMLGKDVIEATTFSTFMVIKEGSIYRHMSTPGYKPLVDMYYTTPITQYSGVIPQITANCDVVARSVGNRLGVISVCNLLKNRIELPGRYIPIEYKWPERKTFKGRIKQNGSWKDYYIRTKDINELSDYMKTFGLIVDIKFNKLTVYAPYWSSSNIEAMDGSFRKYEESSFGDRYVSDAITYIAYIAETVL